MRLSSRVDLPADLNAQDDDGHGWSIMGDAPDPTRIVPGAVILAGNSQAQALVRIIAIGRQFHARYSSSDSS